MYNLYFEKRSIAICERNTKKLKDPNSIILHISKDYDFDNILDILNNSPKINDIVILSNDIGPEDIFKKICSLFRELNAAGGLVENEKGEILLIYRDDMWDLPKGKQEPGEDIKISALREVEEECGIDKMVLGDMICVTSHCYRLEEKFFLKHTYWYNMKYLNGHKPVPQIEENIQKAVWVKRAELDAYLKETYPSIREVFLKAGISW